MSTIVSPNVTQTDYTELSARSVPTNFEMSPTGSRPQGEPGVGISEAEQEQMQEPERPPAARLVTLALAGYLVYRLLT